MIKSFRCNETEKIFNMVASRKLPVNIQQRARRKLLMLDAATTLEDLLVPPSNHLEKLKGNRRQQYSIRINQQWRLCFCWLDENAHQVEIIDYH